MLKEGERFTPEFVTTPEFEAFLASLEPLQRMALHAQICRDLLKWPCSEFFQFFDALNAACDTTGRVRPKFQLDGRIDAPYLYAWSEHHGIEWPLNDNSAPHDDSEDDHHLGYSDTDLIPRKVRVGLIKAGLSAPDDHYLERGE